MEDHIISVSEFVELTNQTLEYAFPILRIEGEITELKISRNKWVYFNLQDDTASVRVFGSVYQLRGVYEDGMKVVVKGTPRLHTRYGFSFNMSMIQPSGEGSIKKAFEKLRLKLTEEGLFDEARKRPLPRFPQKIGLITSAQAAAYSDFMKILDERWGGVDIQHIDVAVQGETAPPQIVRAITHFNETTDVDVLVITRGGGSAEDLMAFSDERVVRAIAGSRIPTLVGVGHEVDISLADLATDVRATTPTNAAQLVVPHRDEVKHTLHRAVRGMLGAFTRPQQELQYMLKSITEGTERVLDLHKTDVLEKERSILSHMKRNLTESQAAVIAAVRQLELVNPHNVLKRGYSIVADAKGKAVTNAAKLKPGDALVIRFNKGSAETEVRHVTKE